MPEAAGEPGETDPERRRRRRELAILLTPLSLAVVSGFVASALTPTLLARHPLALVALDPRNRNLVLTASLVDTVPFFVVAALRMLVVDPFTFLLGRRYGDVGVDWIKRRFVGMAPTVEWLERLFGRAAPLAVAFAPGAVVCTLAGAARMSIPLFFTANLTGTVVRIAILRATGDIFSAPVDAVRRFFDRYIIWTTAASVILVLVWILMERQQGKAEVESPSDLAEELEERIEEAEGGAP